MRILPHLLTSACGTLLPRANAAARPQLADADIRVLNEEPRWDSRGAKCLFTLRADAHSRDRSRR